MSQLGCWAASLSFLPASAGMSGAIDGASALASGAGSGLSRRLSDWSGGGFRRQSHVLRDGRQSLRSEYRVHGAAQRNVIVCVDVLAQAEDARQSVADGEVVRYECALGPAILPVRLLLGEFDHPHVEADVDSGDMEDVGGCHQLLCAVGSQRRNDAVAGFARFVFLGHGLGLSMLLRDGIVPYAKSYSTAAGGCQVEIFVEIRGIPAIKDSLIAGRGGRRLLGTKSPARRRPPLARSSTRWIGIRWIRAAARGDWVPRAAPPDSYKPSRTPPTVPSGASAIASRGEGVNPPSRGAWCICD